MNDATDEWLAPLFRAMTKHQGRSLGEVIQSVVTTKGDLDRVVLGRAMRDELGWNDYPASPPPPPEISG